MTSAFSRVFRPALAIAVCAVGWPPADSVAAAKVVIVYVSPAGQPVHGPISTVAPIAHTLQDAISIVRALKSKGPADQSYRIEMQAGTYRQDTAVVLSAADSGTAAAPLIIEGPLGRKAVLDGGVLLTEVPRPSLSSVESRIPASARTHLLHLAVPPDLERSWNDYSTFGYSLPPPPRGMPTQIVEDSQATVLARWPASGFTTIESDSAQPADGFSIVNNAPVPVPGATDLVAFGYWGNNWSTEWIQVRSDDNIHFSVIGARPPLGLKSGQRAFLAGAPEFLGTPGQWLFDRVGHQVLYTPISRAPSPQIEALVSPQILAINGASHIRVRSLTIENARDDLVASTNVDDVVVSDVTLRNAGRSAAIFSSATHSGLENSNVNSTGGTAIIISGGQRESLIAGGNFARGNRITDFGRLMATYQPGISLQGVGNVVERNELANSPHAAILFSGNDHRITRNIIHDVVRDTDDAGAIYTGRDWTAQGNVIANNFMFDIHGIGPHGATAIYLDDQASGISVVDNLVVRADRGVLIGGGRANSVIGNLFVDCPVGIFADDRGLTWQRQQTQDPNWTLQSQLRHFDVRHAPYSDRYPSLASISEADFGVPVDNKVQDNMVIGGTALDLKMGPQSAARQVISGNTQLANSPNLWMSAQEPGRATDAQVYALSRGVLDASPWFHQPDLTDVGPSIAP